MFKLKLKKLNILTGLLKVISLILLITFTVPFVYFVGIYDLVLVYETVVILQDRARYIENSLQGDDIDKNIRDRVVSIVNRGGRGTGYILEPGVIITVAHVISRGSKEVTVFNAGNPETKYKVLYVFREHDIAILIDKASRKLTTKSLETLGTLNKNDKITAVGYGIDSKLMLVAGLVGPDSLSSDNFVSYTSPFISGMSGGPIFDSEGKLIGLVSSGYDVFHLKSDDERARLKKAYKDFINKGIEGDQNDIILGRIITYPSNGVKLKNIKSSIDAVLLKQQSALNKYTVMI